MQLVSSVGGTQKKRPKEGFLWSKAADSRVYEIAGQPDVSGIAGRVVRYTR
ncbi:hypothetical protein [Paenibacillus pinistramenti]|uniref:hypothetical protein n=1 Tax=Paenibacillus pinistramenti TaxID=1768003 RepID=UPI0013968BE3|nr:hypothetical protein [Paenibacillus pinistramenti]